MIHSGAHAVQVVVVLSILGVLLCYLMITVKRALVKLPSNIYQEWWETHCSHCGGRLPELHLGSGIERFCSPACSTTYRFIRDIRQAVKA
ncbi:MAG: hypothetical protein KKE20_05535 [Nanoarchaeota archaeon]|nr:hypothetical protein [Nanoarchaeota archaeon]